MPGDERKKTVESSLFPTQEFVRPQERAEVPAITGDFGKFEEPADGVVVVANGLAETKQVLSRVNRVAAEGAFSAGGYMRG